MNGVPVATPHESPIVLSSSLRQRLIDAVRQRFPRKSFGYLISDVDAFTPTDFVMFEENIRNTDFWRPHFQSYGHYFVEHDDAGFVATPEESWRVQQLIWARGMTEVGIFHSHQRHPANFSRIDYDLHLQRFANLWHMVISMRNPDQPQLRIFRVAPRAVREMQVAESRESRPGRARGTNAALRIARETLKLASDGRPICQDACAVVSAIEGLARSGDADAFQECVVSGFLRDSATRFAEWVQPDMLHIPPSAFEMGAEADGTEHFYGESPRHPVRLSGFQLSRFAVTNELYAVLDCRRHDVLHADRRKPVVNVDWFEANLFAWWMGCRLPTEAEWEFACAQGAPEDWCCKEEALLPKYAWYSQNSLGETHVVGTRAPNCLGLFDLHGNSWEWCQDAYDQDFYSRAPIQDPCNRPHGVAAYHQMASRGGSMHSLSEMCRSRYRFHEAASFSAHDLGFRLAHETQYAIER